MTPTVPETRAGRRNEDLPCPARTEPMRQSESTHGSKATLLLCPARFR